MKHKKMDSYLLKKFDEVEKIHWWWNGRRELIKILLNNKKPKKILDVGCGTGETLSYLSTLFPKANLVGVDTSSMAIRYSHKRGHTKIIKANASSLPFKDNSFDVVLLLDVLEHISRDDIALSEAKRVLKNNGRIIITGPALNFIWSDHDINQGHKRRLTRRRMRYLATKTGLKVVKLSYFNFVLSFPIIIIRLLSNSKMFGKYFKYSNDINFDIIYKKWLNDLLTFMFVSEIKFLKLINYPIGISIVTVYKK